MNCPLCQATLKVGGINMQDVFCPKLVECHGRPLYHYKLKPIEYAFVFPYRLTTYETNDYYSVHTVNPKFSSIQWIPVCEVPKFPLMASEPLLKKIKLIVTFS